MMPVNFSGLDKFAHLEDKIHRTIEFARTLQAENGALQREVESLRIQLQSKVIERDTLMAQYESLLSERDAIRAKVESMLDAIAVLDTAVVESVN